MRIFILVTSCFFAFSVWHVHAAETVNKNSTTNPIAKHLQEINSPNSNTRSIVKFVVGNDLWQPQQQFKAGTSWLALTCNTTGCSLEPAKLNVKQESWQGHYDDKPTLGQHLTFKAEVGDRQKVVTWFNTASAQSWLKPGAVTTYYSSQSPISLPLGRGTLEAMIDLPKGNSVLLVPLLATKEYLDRVQPETEHSWPLAFLQLREKNKRQLLQGSLGTCSGVFHPRQYLLWSGDLDRDGKPDFIISFIDADGPIHLYLSSVAKPDQLVGLAGVYNSPPYGGECDGPGGFMNFQADNTK